MERLFVILYCRVCIHSYRPEKVKCACNSDLRPLQPSTAKTHTHLSPGAWPRDRHPHAYIHTQASPFTHTHTHKCMNIVKAHPYTYRFLCARMQKSTGTHGMWRKLRTCKCWKSISYMLYLDCEWMIGVYRGAAYHRHVWSLSWWKPTSETIAPFLPASTLWATFCHHCGHTHSLNRHYSSGSGVLKDRSK